MGVKVVRTFWRQFGAKWRQLAPNWRHVAVFWRHLAPKFGDCARPPNWRQFGGFLAPNGATWRHLAIQKRQMLAVFGGTATWRCAFLWKNRVHRQVAPIWRQFGTMCPPPSGANLAPFGAIWRVRTLRSAYIQP